jgi:hypothetical protein
VQPDIGTLRPIIDEGDKVFERAAGKLTVGGAVGGAGHRDHAAGAALRRPAAARDVPPHRLADGRLDLDRRPDRLRGRPHRAVAGADAAAAAARAGYAARVARELGRA